MVTGRKVLLLESDSAVSFPLSSALRKNGWAVISARDAAQAMQVGRQQKPDAVVLNAQLAGGGGLTALKRLRSSVYTAMIPVICIVAEGSRERAEFAASGAQELVPPPGDPAAINAALDRHLLRGEVPLQVPPAVLGGDSRMAALKDSGLLDSPEEQMFDNLMRLTAKLLNVPVAMVSVLNGERQFVKSQVGLPEPTASSRQVSLSHSFCQWVVGGNEEVVIRDAREDPVMRTNPAIREMGVTAYAGFPVAASSEAIGSFCAVDSKPRDWSEDELATMRDLSLVLQSYVDQNTNGQDQQERIASAGQAILGATRTLLRDSLQGGPVERRELARIVEQQSHLLVQLSAGEPAR